MNQNNYLNQISVLYVEDDLSTLEIYSKRFKTIFKEFYKASNAKDAYDIFVQNSPDIIITDIKMAGMDGLELAEKIRELNSDAPIIITSAYNTVNYLTQALHLDISGYLIKPINNKKLFAMLITQAKTILAKKIEQQNQKMLQAVINADSHMLVVTDLEQIFFSNNTFLNFFHLQDNSQFNKKYKRFTEIFLAHNDVLHEDKIEDEENFMELYLKTTEINRNVMLFDFNSFKPMTFHIKITPIERREKKDIYLVTLMDISMMTIEKVELKNRVYHDSLTNVYNRNKLDEVFQSELEQASEQDSYFSMILIDIDHFKSFNDTYGHLVGDEVLVILAKTIDKTTRASDTFARWGGEEFAMILPDTSKQNAALVAEHLRKDIEKLKHKTAGKITASFGVAQFEKGDTQESIYNKCDKALYRAKSNGRNRVEII
jgi:two-component system cell cycle response regulator